MRKFPIVEPADRPLVKALAIELIQTDGVLSAGPAMFGWLDWPPAQIALEGDRVSVRSIWAVEKALLLLPVIKKFAEVKSGL